MHQREQRDTQGGNQQRHREQFLAGQELENCREPGQRSGGNRVQAPAHHDLVAEDQSDRREDSHQHVRVAEGLRHQGGAEPIDQPGQEAGQVPIDEAAGGQKSAEGRERDAAGDEQVVGGHRTEERRDRPQHDGREDHRGVPHEVDARRIRQGVREERVQPV